MNERIPANEPELSDYDERRKTTGNWMKQHAAPGLVVVIRCGVSHLYDEHLLDEIIELKSGRIWTRTPLSHKSRTVGRYYFSGQSCDDPTGQVEMLIPTPDVVRTAIEDKSCVHSRHIHRALIEKARKQTSQLFGHCN